MHQKFTWSSLAALEEREKCVEGGGGGEGKESNRWKKGEGVLLPSERGNGRDFFLNSEEI